MSEGKKIIFFSRDLKVGGMEKALVVLLNALISSDYNVTLVLEKKEGGLLKALDKRITVREYRLSYNRNVLIRKAVNFLHRFMWSALNYNKYDFSCNYATYSVIGSKLAAVASRNSSLYVHSDYYEYYSGDEGVIKTFFVQQGITELKHIIFVSNEAKTKIELVCPDCAQKFCVISNLIDSCGIVSDSTKKTEYEKVAGKQLILFVGRLEEKSKRLSRLIKSFKHVAEQSDAYRLLIVGDGADRDLCEKYIEKYKLSHYVKMLGETNNPYPYIKMADCVILTSDFEGFPVIYNECLVLKTPIITTIPVSDNYLDFRNYSVLTEKDSKQIAEELLKKSYANIIFKKVDIEEINRKRLENIKQIINN